MLSEANTPFFFIHALGVTFESKMRFSREKNSKSSPLKFDWEQVKTIDAKLRIQQAFEMLLGNEFDLFFSRPNSPVNKSIERRYNKTASKIEHRMPTSR